jgi:hypothetical protein
VAPALNVGACPLPRVKSRPSRNVRFCNPDLQACPPLRRWWGTSGHRTSASGFTVHGLIHRACGNPTGKSPKTCPAPLLKIFRFSVCANHLHIRRRPVPHRGAARDRHERGAGCGGRRRRFDEGACMRTAKSCGPDAPTLASSFRGTVSARARVARKPGHPGEREGNR